MSISLIRHSILLCAAIALLAGCASGTRPTPPQQASTEPVAPRLVIDGKLTEAGTAMRDKGLSFYQNHRDVEAYQQWLPLAEQGHGESLFNMGVMTRDGLGVAADPQAGLAWMRKAAQAGYISAYLDVGGAYSRGDLVPRDPAEALRWWREGAERGDTPCAAAAGRWLVEGKQVPKNVALGVTLLTQAANAADADADSQGLLGRMYLDGTEVAQDFAKARTLLEAAARCDCSDDGAALHNLALIYDNGYGVPVDKAKGIELYLKAARKSNPASINNLGYAYRHGEGVPMDRAKALEYFARADALGNLDATVNLGDMYFMGWGTPADRARAATIYKRAAEAGMPVAQCRYAQALAHGDGVAKDPRESLRWALEANSRRLGLQCSGQLEATLH